jgi:hypothetical protein
MNRLARTSGVAVSVLTAVTASILLLMPGHPRLEYPEATMGASGGTAVTPQATAPAGNGTARGAVASARAGRLTAGVSSGPSSPSSPSSAPAGDSPPPGLGQALSAGLLRPALPPLCLHPLVATAQPSPAGPIGDPGARRLPGCPGRVLPDAPCLPHPGHPHARGRR